MCAEAVFPPICAERLYTGTEKQNNFINLPVPINNYMIVVKACINNQAFDQSERLLDDTQHEKKHQ